MKNEENKKFARIFAINQKIKAQLMAKEPSCFDNHKISKKILLCIIDGWGIGDKDDVNNAISQAKLEFYPRILAKYPNSQLETSGLAVGLPDGQIGNSEVGHITIGAGRVIFQDLPRINNAIKDGSLKKNQYIQNLINDFANKDNICHLIGLLSDGGVHSHIDHLIFLAELLMANKVKIAIHCFLDGRDVAQKSALKYLEKIAHLPIATISGRYYGMDRDKKWDRISKSYYAIANGLNGDSPVFPSYNQAIDYYYQQNITDEFIMPTAIGNYSGLKDGDGLIFCNFRADRARQICRSLLDDDFDEFARKKIDFSHSISMVEYSSELNKFFKILFPNQEIKNSLPEIVANNGKSQLRIAETEKYIHVSFFFSCGREQEFRGEERILIPSPAVATYDLKPEMSLDFLVKNLIDKINDKKVDLIVANFANADMVGHSGCLSASINACKAIDIAIKKVSDAILDNDYLMIITADHGNIEMMCDIEGNPHTSHTTNPVPFILIGNNIEDIKLKNGSLQDIAPTILQLMNIDKPKEMTGSSLITN